MSDCPTISVLMPVYNGEPYLAEAVESLLAQTFGDFELLVLDDGSTDGTPALLEMFARRDPRVRVTTRANRGLTKSLNECLRLARGEFVARMDADDVALPDRFRRQVEFLRAHPDVVVLGGAYDLIDAGGRLLRRMNQPLDDPALQHACLTGRTPICHPLAMMRREAALRVGGYDETMLVAQDLDLWLRLGEVGKLACLPDVLLKYRLHETSVSEKKQRLQVETMRRACEAAWKRRGITSGQFLIGEQGWRPDADSSQGARHAYATKYGWWAFNSGQRQTALRYAWRAIRIAPLRPEGWKLLLCAAARPLPAEKQPQPQSQPQPQQQQPA